LIKTAVGGLSGPACLPQSDQVAIPSLPFAKKRVVPGTDYEISYYKPANSPQLLVKKFPKDDEHASITRSEFLSLALRLAEDRARELGWIM
jgi:hypothetical protein